MHSQKTQFDPMFSILSSISSVLNFMDKFPLILTIVHVSRNPTLYATSSALSTYIGCNWEFGYTKPIYLDHSSSFNYNTNIWTIMLCLYTDTNTFYLISNFTYTFLWKLHKKGHTYMHAIFLKRLFSFYVFLYLFLKAMKSTYFRVV